jgi:hypothetical protein
VEVDFVFLRFVAALVESHLKTTMPVYLLLPGRAFLALNGGIKLFEMTVFGAG